MSQYTENEQLASLNRFWQQYALPMIVGLVIALAAVYGYKWWNQHQVASVQKASTMYENMLQIVNEVPAGQPLKETSYQQLVEINNQLQTDYGKMSYADYAPLFVAQAQVTHKDYDKAKATLESLIKTSSDKNIQDLARLRLARLELNFSQDGVKKALQLISSGNKGTFAVSYAALEGDIYAKLGSAKKAKQSYLRAIALAKKKELKLPLVQLKLNNLVLSAGA